MRFLGLAGLAALLVLGGCNKPAATAPDATTTTATTAVAAPTQDWTQVIVATPEGGFRMGNPDAKVKLLEFASLTCPHCREFHEQGMPTVTGTYVKSGKLSYEYRPFILNGIDFAPSLLVRCQPANVAFNLIGAFYENQPSWVQPFTKLTPDDQKRLQALPAEQQIKALALTGGLDAFVRARGIPRAKFDQCLSDKAGVDKLSAIRDEAVTKYQLTGTPTFAINGTTQTDVFNWAKLQPKLETALQ